MGGKETTCFAKSGVFTLNSAFWLQDEVAYHIIANRYNFFFHFSRYFWAVLDPHWSNQNAQFHKYWRWVAADQRKRSTWAEHLMLSQRRADGATDMARRPYNHRALSDSETEGDAIPAEHETGAVAKGRLRFNPRPIPLFCHLEGSASSNEN